MEYILADRNSTGFETYWFRRSIPTLEDAMILASLYPEAHYILEYCDDNESYKVRGVVPTGRSWPVNPTAGKEEQ